MAGTVAAPRGSCHLVPNYAPAPMRTDRPPWVDNFRSWGTAAQRPTSAAVLRSTAAKGAQSATEL
eukprot:7108573-Prymnesium_polylepis.1